MGKQKMEGSKNKAIYPRYVANAVAQQNILHVVWRSERDDSPISFDASRLELSQLSTSCQFSLRRTPHLPPFIPRARARWGLDRKLLQLSF
jgi:hypothetical protein